MKNKGYRRGIERSVLEGGDRKTIRENLPGRKRTNCRRRPAMRREGFLPRHRKETGEKSSIRKKQFMMGKKDNYVRTMNPEESVSPETIRREKKTLSARNQLPGRKNSEGEQIPVGTGRKMSPIVFSNQYSVYGEQDKSSKGQRKNRLVIRQKQKSLPHIYQPVSQRKGLSFSKKNAGNKAASIGEKVFLLPVAAVVILLILFSCVLSSGTGLIAGKEAITYQCQVSETTERYRELVEEYCKTYGIPDYVDLVLAVIEQESGGKGIDIMQCSASGFNINPPIDTAEESIDVGVHTFSDCVKRSHTESPFDMETVSLALQGYNYGNGYIEWALKTDGGYTKENAVLFSRQMCQALNCKTYGDPEYVPHVLRYYVSNEKEEITSAKAALLLQELKKNNEAETDLWEVIERGASLAGKITYGMLEPPRQDDGREQPTVLDCSSFVAWCFHKSGYTSIPYQSTTATFADSSRFVTVSAGELKVGDIGLKGKDLPTGGSNHVGIYCGQRKDGTKVWLHCTSYSGTSLTENDRGVLMGTYSNFTYFRRIKRGGPI